MEANLAYYETPRDANGVIKAKTRELRSWEFNRTMRALESLNDEFNGVEFPGVYVLLFKNKKWAYVGEAKSIYGRLKTHMERPEKKLKDWTHVLVLNDGRHATQSEFNDAVIRKTLEHYIIRLLKINKYTVLSQGEEQRHNPIQKATLDNYIPEVNFHLLKKNLITKLEDKIGEELVLRDELLKILKGKGYSIKKWHANEAEIDGETAFIRPGSKKPKGWQITIRGRQPGSFIDSLQKGRGYILMPRDGILLIPLSEVQKIIDKDAYLQDTIDVWVNFDENGAAELSYKEKKLDVTSFKILQ